MPKVLIAGGAGFIGTHMTEYLLKRGWEVVSVDNFSTGKRENVERFRGDPRFTFHEMDITEAVPEGDYDYIINLASPASPQKYLSLPLDTMLVNSIGVKNLLDLAKRSGATFLLASTSEVYGDPLVHPQPETYWGNVNPVGPRSVYDEGKRFAEAITMAYHRYEGVPVRIARIFNTYGPYMDVADGRIISNFASQALLGKPLTIYGDGSQTRSFCYVSDMVEGLFRLLTYEGLDGEVVNLGNPEEWRVIDVAKLVVRLLGLEENFSFLPLPQDDPKRRKPDITKAKRLLGWEPKVPFEEGLRRTLKWYREVLNVG
ncbi:MAG: SDR family oxidoreductase [Thermotogae bacterium]|nr:SDR family oxidoreductase [Thermotogota bacterium]